MADEGAGGNIAGEQCGADDPGDQRGERQRLPQQAPLCECGAAKDRRRIEKKQISRTGETRVGAACALAAARTTTPAPNQPGEDEQDGEAHAVSSPRPG